MIERAFNFGIACVNYFSILQFRGWDRFDSFCNWKLSFPFSEEVSATDGNVTCVWVRLGLRWAACIYCTSSGLERMRGLERRVAKGKGEEEDDILMSYRRSRWWGKVQEVLVKKELVVAHVSRWQASVSSDASKGISRTPVEKHPRKWRTCLQDMLMSMGAWLQKSCCNFWKMCKGSQMPLCTTQSSSWSTSWAQLAVNFIMACWTWRVSFSFSSALPWMLHLHQTWAPSSILVITCWCHCLFLGLFLSLTLNASLASKWASSTSCNSMYSLRFKMKVMF